MKKLFECSERQNGAGPAYFAWQPRGNFLASAGQNGVLHVYDRHGSEVFEYALPTRGPCKALEWDCDGETLAVIQDGISQVNLWDLSSRRLITLDGSSNLKDPTYLCWAKRGPQLAVGDARGNLLLYNKETRRKVPVVGKHENAIISGSWSSNGLLVLGSEDRVLTFSDDKGKTLDTTELQHIPTQLSFMRQKVDGPSAAARQDTTVMVNMNGNAVLLYDIQQQNDPLELGFDEKYGAVVGFDWFGDGYLIAAFTGGYVAVVSTHPNEVNDEIFGAYLTKDTIMSMAFSYSLKRCAIADTRGIRVLDTTTREEVKGDYTAIDSMAGRVERIAWTSDGQILTVSTTGGRVTSYLASMPLMSGVFGSKVAHLSSLKELAVVDVLAPPNTTTGITVPLSIEPTAVALGPRHAAVAINSKVCFHRLLVTPPGSPPSPILEKEYLASVQAITLDDTNAAVLCGGRVNIHPIEGPPGAKSIVFPPADKPGTATCVRAAGGMLFVGHSSGAVDVVHLSTGKVLDGCRFKHPLADAAEAGGGGPSSGAGGASPSAAGAASIGGLYPNIAGTRVVIADSAGACFLFNPVDGSALEVPLPTKADEQRAIEVEEKGAAVAPRGAASGSGSGGVSLLPQQVIWDPADWGSFVVATGRTVHSYHYVPLTVRGAQLERIGSTAVAEDGSLTTVGVGTVVPHGGRPAVSYDGVLFAQLQGGRIERVTLASHKHLSAPPKHQMVDPDVLRGGFGQALALNRFDRAWEAAVVAKSDRSLFLALANRAMENLEVAEAVKCYRYLGDAAMVMALEAVKHVEDQNLLAGHMALLFADYDTAQQLFLDSRQPFEALRMRKDLLHWDKALRLAEALAAWEVPECAAQLGRQTELRGDSSTALTLYHTAEESLAGVVSGASGTEAASSLTRFDYKRVQTMCDAGQARCLLRSGEVVQGMKRARKVVDRAVVADCAAICVELKLWHEAAELYERCDQTEEAAQILISAKEFSAVAKLIPRVHAPKLLAAYAKALEVEGRFKEAVRVYERARDSDAVVRILIDKLHQPDKAGEVVRASRSTSAARKLSMWCQENDNPRGAIEFLLIAGQRSEAFELAAATNEMQQYVQALLDAAKAAIAAQEQRGGAASSRTAGKSDSDGDKGSNLIPPEEYVKVAQYFEERGEAAEAGKFYQRASRYGKALTLFMQCGEDKLEDAVEVTGKARQDVLTTTLIDFLTGESDGVPKDQIYIYKLYIALQDYTQATRTAVTIARQHREMGEYAAAKALLLRSFRDLLRIGVRVPHELLRNMELLHSYSLVKPLVKQDRHDGAARLLLRLAGDISKFPKHAEQILASGVVECSRAGLKKSSHALAVRLVGDPELKGKVQEKLMRKIEGIVRRPKTEEAPAETSPCPVCGTVIPAWQLDCPSCKSHLPMDICTGRHMTLENWTSCPSCHQPAHYPDFASYIDKFGTDGGSACPMCKEVVNAVSLKAERDPAGKLRSWIDAVDGDGKAEDEDEEGDGAESGASGAASSGSGAAGGGYRSRRPAGLESPLRGGGQAVSTMQSPYHGGAAAAALAAMGM